MILWSKTIKVGNRVTMGGVRGDVLALGFIQTTLMEMGQPPAVASDPRPSRRDRDRPPPVGMVFASQSSRTREDSHTIRSRAEIRMRITAVLKGLSLLAVAGLFAGCNGTAEDHQSPAQAAQEALKVEGNGHQKTVENQRDVEVVETTKVIDRKTGEVITTKQEVTPVTVQKTKEVDTQVKAGQTTRTVK